MNVEWIAKQITQRGLTQREVAEAIGLTEVQISKVMHGRRKLSASEADGIRRYFGYPLPDALPVGHPLRTVLDGLSVLDDAQKRSLALYLEAIAGDKLKIFQEY